MNNGTENILVLSGDKDYVQLHRYANVKQYNPVQKKWVQNNNPDKYLEEHIIRGDAGDGVPNILSADNCIVVGDRQKAMTAKRLEEFLKGPAFMDETTKSRYQRNKLMIDLNEVPENYKEQIMIEFEKEKEVGRAALFDYFVKRKLKNLLTDIQDF
jgi:hypothetical protein